MADPLDQLQALCEAATPGPWVWERCYELSDCDGNTQKHWALRHPEAEHTVIDGLLVTFTSEHNDWFGKPIGETPNFAFIAACREAVPELIARVRAAESHQFCVDSACPTSALQSRLSALVAAGRKVVETPGVFGALGPELYHQLSALLKENET